MDLKQAEKRSPWPLVLLAGFLAALIWVAAIVAGLAGSPWFNFRPFSGETAQSRSYDFSAPQGELQSAELRLSYAAATVHLRSADLGSELYRAHFQVRGGGRPTASVDPATGVVEVALDHRQGGCFLFCPDRGATVDLTLNSKLPWKLSFMGGASHADLDLSGLRLTGVDVEAGATDVTASLPAPKSHVALNFSGGATSVHLRAPAGTEARIAVTGGSSSLRVNGSPSAAIGDGVDYQTAGYTSAADRYEVSVSGGASSVSWDSA